MASGQQSGRLIAFEGVDGAGKSTVLKNVAEQLRARGETVFLPRVGKDHSSRPTRMIRNLTRDRRNLDLRPRPELLLYCAREAQILDEMVRPALARGETVLIDRSLLTPVVLGMARGLSRDECQRTAALAAAGLEVDLTLVYDVHPRTSRIRKRIERVRTDPDTEGGRKGLAGSAFKERVRDGYQEIARELGFPVLHAERATPDQMTARTMAVIDAFASHGGTPTDGWDGALGEGEADRTPQWMVPEGWDLERALSELPLPVALFLCNSLICARALRAAAAEQEPQLATWAMDPEDPLRERMAEAQPTLALRGLGRRPLSGDDDLRLRLLSVAPAECISALKHLSDPRSDALREQYAEQERDAVLESLVGREDEAAWKLRERCWRGAEDRARASSLGFCGSERAWQRREKLFDKSPAVGLSTLRGLNDPRANEWLERYAELAPKRVLSALGGRTDAIAHQLRQRLFETGREVIDSVRGLGDDASFALREQGLSRWPSTVAHSLLGLGEDARAGDLLGRCAALAHGDVHVLRRVQGVKERPRWPEWARTRTALLQGGGNEE